MEIGPEYIISGFVALSSAIVILWRLELKNQEKCERDLAYTRMLREEDNKEIRELHGKVEYLQGEQKGFMAGVDVLTQTVIAEVRSLKNDEKDS